MKSHAGNTKLTGYEDLVLTTDNYDIKLNAARYINLNCQEIQVPDGLGLITGYTGTKQLGNFNVRFINGLCVSIS